MTEQIDYNEFNRAIIDEFRKNGGTVGGPFEGNPMVLVHHTGAKSGLERIAPLVPLIEDGRIYIFATKAGADTNPDWFHNLVANPQTVIELGTETFPVTARVLTGVERDTVYANQAVAVPQFGVYQTMTTRVIPVIELVRS